jgi:hypothetical protein
MKARYFAICIAVLSWLFVAAPVNAGSIPLVVEGDGPDAVWPVPVKCGVPFPRETLRPDERVVLVDDQGNAQPLQTSVTATWDPKGERGVRWLLVNFTAQRGKAYRLLFGEEAAKAQAETNGESIAKAAADTISLNTGVIRAKCSSNRLDVFASLAGVDKTGQSIPLVAHDWAGPYIEHETRGLFRADLDPDTTVALEENGPLRATIKADGWYTNERGERFCRFSMRIHFFRDEADMRLEHTFIFTGVSNDDRIRDIGVRLPLAGRADTESRYAFGNTRPAEDATEVAVSGQGPAHVYQVMDSPDHRTFEWKAFDAVKNAPIGQGQKIGGWLYAATGRASLLAAVREAWQQYPIEFEWDQTIATVHLWPRHGRLWDTSFDGYWYYLDDAQKNHLIAEKAGTQGVTPEHLTKALRQSNAVGAAKTHEVWLSLRPPAEERDIAAHADALTLKPVYAHADLKWQTQTRALDFLPHHPYDMGTFPDEENYLASIPGLMRLHSNVVHYFGWWDWSAYHEGVQVTHAYRRSGKPFDPPRVEPVWHRAKPKSHYWLGSFPWTMYYRTGQRQWLDYARRYTLYSAERAHCHHDSGTPQYVLGQEYHYDNSEIHWLGGGRGNPNQTMVMNPLMDHQDYVYAYWLTGDRRTLDILKLWGEMFKALMAKDESFLKRYEDGGPFGGYHRTLGGFIDRLCIVYEATWDPGYLPYATRLASLFRGVDASANVRTGQKGAEPSDDLYTWYVNWLYEGLWRYYQITGDEGIKDALLSYCRASTDYSGGFVCGGVGVGNVRWCAYGYELTGETFYLDLGRRMLDREVAAWVSAETMSPGGRKFLSLAMPHFMGVAAETAPQAWKASNLPTHLNGHSIDYVVFHPDISEDLRPVFLLEEEDRPWKVHFAAHQTGKFAIFDPDGNAVATLDVDWRKSIRGEMSVPKDGKSGTYSLVCLGLNPTPYGQPHRLSDGGGYLAWVNILHCDLKKIVYSAPSSTGRHIGFDARSWCFGVPAGAKGVEVHWQPPGLESNGQRDFVIEEVDGPFRISSAEVPADPSGGFPIHKFKIPPADKERVFVCKSSTDRNRILTHAAHNGRRRFAIVGAPPWISADPEGYFVPVRPKRYQPPASPHLQ